MAVRQEGMPMRMIGRVTEDVTRDKEFGRYRINVGGREYEIVSSGRQAIKDYLFIRKGQRVEIEGETEGERIRLIRCRIVLKPDDKENKGGEKTPKQ